MKTRFTILLIVIAAITQWILGCRQMIHDTTLPPDPHAGVEERLEQIERRLEGVERRLGEREEKTTPAVPKPVDEGMMIDELQRRNHRFVR